MPDEFRFLLICLSASRTDADGQVTLKGVINDLETTAGEANELVAMIGAILRPPMSGKRLDLMAWKLGSNGKRQPIGDYVGTQLFLPEGVLGPQVLPCELTLPTPESGIYGYELFDGEGAFGTPERLLATYMFGVNVKGQG